MAVPDECVIVGDKPKTSITTSLVAVGTAPVLQLFGLCQSPSAATHWTVPAMAATLEKSKTTSVTAVLPARSAIASALIVNRKRPEGRDAGVTAVIRGHRPL